jgi:hypothetical protein
MAVTSVTKVATALNENRTSNSITDRKPNSHQNTEKSPNAPAEQHQFQNGCSVSNHHCLNNNNELSYIPNLSNLRTSLK